MWQMGQPGAKPNPGVAKKMTRSVDLQPSKPPTPTRPTSVTVVGILAIVGGALALLTVPMTVAMLGGVWLQTDATRSLCADPLYRGWAKTSIVLGLVVGPLWIATGVGLLRMRRWARATIMILLILGGVTHLVNIAIVVRLFWLAPASAGATHGSFEAQLQKIMVSATTIFGALLGIAYVLVVLFLITRPNVVAAFKKAAW